MNFIEKIDLNSTVLHNKFKEEKNLKRKLNYLFLIASKSIITLLFAFSLVALTSLTIGSENSCVGVTLVLFILTFRKVDLGYDKKETILSIFIIFIILAICPFVANKTSPIVSMVINIISIFIIIILGCAKVEYHNHAIIVLSYLLLYGYPVAKEKYILRIIALMLCSLWIISILLRNHKYNDNKLNIKKVLISLKNLDYNSIWRIEFCTAIPLAMFIGQILNFERPMWIGLAAMSVLTPIIDIRINKFIGRILGTVLGCILFFILIQIVPYKLYMAFGLIGGILVGFTSDYKYQTMFNALGALGIAMSIYGPYSTILHRLINNIFAIAFVFLYSTIIRLIINKLNKKLFKYKTCEND